MSKEEETRLNSFMMSLVKSPKRLATQLPGNDNHTIVIPIEEINEHWRSLVQDLEAMKDEQKE